MCGIFGITIGQDSGLKADSAKRCFSRLFSLSETRGTEAAGMALLGNDSIPVLKGAMI